MTLLRIQLGRGDMWTNTILAMALSLQIMTHYYLSHAGSMI